MKMSDVWAGEFIDFDYGFYSNAETVMGDVFNGDDDNPLCGLLFTNEEPAKAVMHAVRNHDRLTEHNAKLVEYLSKVCDLRDQSMDDAVFWLVDNTDEIIEILNEIKAQ